MGGRVPFRLGTPLGGTSASAGRWPGRGGGSFRCGPHLETLGGGLGEIVEVRHGEPGEGEAGGSFLNTCCSSPEMGPRRQQCAGQSWPCGLRRTSVGYPQLWLRFTGVLPRAEGAPGSNFTFSLGYCDKQREEGGESRVGGPWWRLCVCPSLHSSGLVKPHPFGWQLFGGGGSSWFLGHKKRDHWREMAPVV